MQTATTSLLLLLVNVEADVAEQPLVRSRNFAVVPIRTVDVVSLLVLHDLTRDE